MSAHNLDNFLRHEYEDECPAIRRPLRADNFIGRQENLISVIHDKKTGAGTNLFYQPLDGSKPTQLTHFNTEPLWISAYALSPDRKQCAITRARVNDSDLVMFSSFR